MQGWLPKHRVLSPSPLLFKCWGRSRSRAHSHFSLCLEPLLSELSPAMSSLSGSAVGGDEIPEGSEKKAEATEIMSPASRKRSRPKGSRNKKSLVALVVAAAAATTPSAATRAARALGDAGVPEKWGPGRPRGSGRKSTSTGAATPSLPYRREWPPAAKTRRPSLPLGPLPPTP
jgi:hypothetical protein